MGGEAEPAEENENDNISNEKKLDSKTGNINNKCTLKE